MLYEMDIRSILQIYLIKENETVDVNQFQRNLRDQIHHWCKARHTHLLVFIQEQLIVFYSLI